MKEPPKLIRDVRVFCIPAFIEVIMKIGFYYQNNHSEDGLAALPAGLKALWMVSYLATRFETIVANQRLSMLKSFSRDHHEKRVELGKSNYNRQRSYSMVRASFLPPSDEDPFREMRRRSSAFVGRRGAVLLKEDKKPFPMAAMPVFETEEETRLVALHDQKTKLGQDPLLPTPAQLSKNLLSLRRI